MKYYLCRPLLKNIPLMDGILTTCPICNQECWERPELEEQAKALYAGDEIIESCTECGLREGGRKK